MTFRKRAPCYTSAILMAILNLPAAARAADDPAAKKPEAPAAAPAAAPVAAESAAKETVCDDKKDNDGDGMVDCADADCKDSPACKVGSGPENTNARCSDWFDNDGDGFIDCDDPDCEGQGITVCKGSWKAPAQNDNANVPTGPAADDTGLPDLPGDMSTEDLIGKYGDIDGERNDEVCSDGIDNDGDGKVDCADFGCRFDPDVSVCRGNPGMRFSVVGAVQQSRQVTTAAPTPADDTSFSKVQIRSFGPMPMITNSFYLISLRAERTPRLTFAMFQMPLGARGHYLNVNSGGGGLSAALITSTSNLLLIEAPTYLYSAFEQSNGAAVEAGGPLTKDYGITYRAYISGGSGRSSGNVGGVYYVNDNTNYTYGTGVQFGFNVVGVLNRFDSPFLYTPAPLTFGFTVGAKFDQRSSERYPAANISTVLRYKRLYFQAETYVKRDLDWNFNAIAYNAQIGVLAIPKLLMLSADFGSFIATPFETPPGKLPSELKKQLDEQMWRVAAHLYLWRNIARLSVMYRDRQVEGNADPLSRVDPIHEREGTVTMQFRF